MPTFVPAQTDLLFVICAIGAADLTTLTPCHSMISVESGDQDERTFGACFAVSKTERTGNHGCSWRNRRVFKGLGPDRAGNRGPETREFPIPAANPPAVSEGGFFDHSFGDDANASARVYPC